MLPPDVEASGSARRTAVVARRLRVHTAGRTGRAYEMGGSREARREEAMKDMVQARLAALSEPLSMVDRRRAGAGARVRVPEPE